MDVDIVANLIYPSWELLNLRGWSFKLLPLVR